MDTYDRGLGSEAGVRVRGRDRVRVQGRDRLTTMGWARVALRLGVCIARLKHVSHPAQARCLHLAVASDHPSVVTSPKCRQHAAIRHIRWSTFVESS